jgi:PAS domain S-box-containing protein
LVKGPGDFSAALGAQDVTAEGERMRRPRQRLTLLQKFALLSFFCILGTTVAVCATGAAALQRYILDHDAVVVADLVGTLVTRSLPASALRPGGHGDPAVFERTLAGIMHSSEFVRVLLYDIDGVVVWSDDSTWIGHRVSPTAGFREAMTGKIRIEIIRPEQEFHHASLRSFHRLEEIYFPIRYQKSGPVLGIVEIYRHPPKFFARLDQGLTLVWVLGGGGGVVLYLALFGIVRRASRAHLTLEQQLTSHARTLEERVAARTRELSVKTEELSHMYHEVKATKEYLENLIESSLDAIITVDPRGLVTFISVGGQKMFGYPSDQIIGTAVRTYWTRGPRDFRAFRRALAAKGRLQNHETELWTADGEIRWVNISASLLYDTDGRALGVAAVVKDFTEHRRLHQHGMRAERLAAAGLLAAGVAHEIGNPLTCISSLSQMLAARSTEPSLRQGMEDIQLHTGRIQRIVQDLNQLTRPAPVQMRTCALEEVTENAVRLARHNPAVRRMSIEVCPGPPLPPVRAATDQLLQVFLNLILNATDAGGDLTVTFGGAGSNVWVVFTDTGGGMAAEQLQRLFDPFYSTKDGDAHLGLGLFVSQEIVRQHGGMIVAESRPAQGSSFAVVLPAERALAPTEGA